MSDGIIFGSGDSLDVDICYVFNKLPSIEDCKRFCSADKSENRNIICVDNGIVTATFKGSIDEVNNSIFRTYSLHEQTRFNPIYNTVERNVALKIGRTIRALLSLTSRTEQRKMIKLALKSYKWTDKLYALSSIDLREITDFKKLSKIEAYKAYAFQIGQCLALINGFELYTKSDISKYLTVLKPYLYREDVTVDDLQEIFTQFVTMLYTLEVQQLGKVVKFEKYDTILDIKTI